MAEHKHYFRKSDNACSCGEVGPQGVHEQVDTPVAQPAVEVNQDPDNPGTVILSRWPTEEEKPVVREQLVALRKGKA